MLINRVNRTNGFVIAFNKVRYKSFMKINSENQQIRPRRILEYDRLQYVVKVKCQKE